MSTSYEQVVARLDRLPVTRWHNFVRVVLGFCTFFDFFDVAAVAYVLPALIAVWHLASTDIGLLIASGFAGQLIGATLFGWVGERYGRIFGLNISILFVSVFGLACAFAWNYQALLVLRFLQGIGLGGEAPMAVTYVNEISCTERRGRFVLLFQIMSPLGLMGAALIGSWVVPHLGWQWMFIVGAVPAFAMIVIRRSIPESPRWLARQGRLHDADLVLQRIEACAPGPATAPTIPVMPGPRFDQAPVGNLFRGIYFGRTISVWLMWFCANMIGYGLIVWMPSLFRTVYKLPLEQSLEYSILGNVTVLIVAIAAALVIDRFGRRPIFIISYLCAAVPLLVLWAINTQSAVLVMLLAALGSTSISAAQLTVWVYTSEVYPTSLRSIGTGAASSSARLASILAPWLVGWLLSATNDVGNVFLMFAAAGLVGTLVVIFFGVETSRKLLEEISPDVVAPSHEFKKARV
jgi:MFS transporter, putative metabolite:H+ symporter